METLTILMAENLTMKLIFKKSTLIKIIVVMTLFLSSFTSKSEPYLAYKHKLKCMVCHVNPNGGGQRTEFGRAFGQTVLPAKANPFDANKLAQISQYISMGSDARFDAHYQKNNNKDVSKSFDVTSALIYANIVLPETGLSFYIDEQIAPGSAINREAWAMMTFDNGDFVKIGKMFLPYGMRIEDDNAFIRQNTGMNFDNSDNGVEYTLNYENSAINLFIANGTNQTTNDDDKFLYGVRVEHLFSSYRIGSTFVINKNEQKTKMYNFYSGVSWGNFTLFGEVDFINFETQDNVNNTDINQLITLAEINYQWQNGLNFKITAEFFDPDRDIDENEQTRYSFVTEYTPISNIQLRLGIRVKQDIPQKPTQTHDLIFLQSHFYF